MARPMILIPKLLLEEIYERYQAGVPTTVLRRKNQLTMSRPTLAKLLAIREKMDKIQDTETHNKIEASIYPEWLYNIKMEIKQPMGWRYRGQFPLGEWEEYDWSEE